MANRLSSITTRTGDDGTTGLADGSRIDKDSNRIIAIGSVDELNSLLGIIITSSDDDGISGYLLNIQHRLFDIGGELAMPGNAMISDNTIDRLEELIDLFNQDLPSLKEFILPGGNLPGSICHLARTVCRRAERDLISLSRDEFVNPLTIVYMNRLSDLLFIFARTLVVSKGNKETYWNSERLKRSV